MQQLINSLISAPFRYTSDMKLYKYQLKIPLKHYIEIKVIYYIAHRYDDIFDKNKNKNNFISENMTMIIK